MKHLKNSQILCAHMPIFVGPVTIIENQTESGWHSSSGLVQLSSVGVYTEVKTETSHAEQSQRVSVNTVLN